MEYIYCTFWHQCFNTTLYFHINTGQASLNCKISAHFHRYLETKQGVLLKGLFRCCIVRQLLRLTSAVKQRFVSRTQAVSMQFFSSVRLNELCVTMCAYSDAQLWMWQAYAGWRKYKSLWYWSSNYKIVKVTTTWYTVITIDSLMSLLYIEHVLRMYYLILSYYRTLENFMGMLD